jgi:hypothetical protein
MTVGHKRRAARERIAQQSIDSSGVAVEIEQGACVRPVHTGIRMYSHAAS